MHVYKSVFVRNNLIFYFACLNALSDVLLLWGSVNVARNYVLNAFFFPMLWGRQNALSWLKVTDDFFSVVCIHV